MSGVSTFQYQQMLARLAKGQPSPVALSGCDREVGKGGLHEQIEDYCKNKMWPIVHSRTDMRSTTIPGTPDFIIAASGGRTFWIEAKAKGKKQTTDQKGFELLLKMNSHKYDLVYSFEEFLAVVETK